MDTWKKFILVVALSTTMGNIATAEEYNVGALKIETPWARPSIGKKGNSAAYMTIMNTGGVADTLVAVATPRADKAQLHTRIYDKDIVRMRHVKDGIPVPAHGEVALKPGGYHIMLMRLDTPIKKGESVPLILTFKKAGKVTVQAHVQMKPGMKGHMNKKMEHKHK